MIIFDSTSIAFIQKSEQMLREILTSIGLTVNRKRFEFYGRYCPIHIVVFEGTNELAHFNSAFLQIALNRKLIWNAKDAIVRDILKHELAHYLTYIQYGSVQAHGAEFKLICDTYGFDQEISAATMDLEEANHSKVGNLESERVLEKVKKLLKLAQSSNAHEAELATAKANALLLRHNLDYVDHIDEAIYMDQVIIQKRKDSKLIAIYEILRHFIVKPIFSFGKNTCALEVSGSETNVKLALYVANFLNQELDYLWNEARKEKSLSGLRAKNSFFLGVAKGFNEKMQASKEGLSDQDQKSLVKIENKLNLHLKMIYTRLTNTKTSNRIDERAQSAGVASGKNLTIRQGVEGKKTNLFIGFFN